MVNDYIKINTEGLGKIRVNAIVTDATGPLLSSAPIFAADFPNRPPVPIRLSEAIKKISFDWNSNHCIFKRNPMQDGRRLPRDFIKGLKEVQHERPMDSLLDMSFRASKSTMHV